MGDSSIYSGIMDAIKNRKKLLAVLIDPDKFDLLQSAAFLRKLPNATTHLFVGGSTVSKGATETLVKELKMYTAKPIVLFPGDVSQLTAHAHATLFLTLFSGDNPEYLTGQHIKAVPVLRSLSLEVIPTGYILIDGGKLSAVARVTGTLAIPQQEVQRIVDTAKAAELSGKKLLYLEAGSGALNSISSEIISAVKKELKIPLIVGGGIRTEDQKQAAYNAGANMVVMGTAFETDGI
jgi:putative glycerol-1-phosphate prenyltransferase